MLARIKTFVGDDSGATAVEYGLIVAAIAAVVMLAFGLIGSKVNNTLVNIAAALP
jgi:pilus assembly protein Flp/PilA